VNRLPAKRNALSVQAMASGGGDGDAGIFEEIIDACNAQKNRTVKIMVSAPSFSTLSRTS
jgi:hypothetical protein